MHFDPCSGLHIITQLRSRCAPVWLRPAHYRLRAYRVLHTSLRCGLWRSTFISSSKPTPVFLPSESRHWMKLKTLERPCQFQNRIVRECVASQAKWLWDHHRKASWHQMMQEGHVCAHLVGEPVNTFSDMKCLGICIDIAYLLATFRSLPVSIRLHRKNPSTEYALDRRMPCHQGPGGSDADSERCYGCSSSSNNPEPKQGGLRTMHRSDCIACHCCDVDMRYERSGPEEFDSE